MKAHATLEPSVTGTLGMSFSRFVALFSSGKVNLEEKNEKASAVTFSQRWAGTLQLKRNQEPRLKRLKKKYYL